MKKLLWSITLLLWLFGMYSCSEDFIPLEEVTSLQQDFNVSFTGDNVVQGQLIIKLAKEPTEVKIVQTRSGNPLVETGIKTIDDICTNIGASSMRRVFPHSGKFETRSREAGLHLWYIVEFPKEVSLTRTAIDFSNNEDIALVEPVHIIMPPSDDLKVVTDSDPISHIQTRSTVGDPLSGKQWHYMNTGNKTGFVYGADINLYRARVKTVGHPNVIVAVVDGGIERTHEDLEDNMWVNVGEIPNNGIDDDHNGYIDDYYGYNFYNRTHNIIAGDHGTHVAGIIGAVNNNGKGVSGIAGGNKASNEKGVRLMNCQVLDPVTGVGTSESNIAEAIKYGADNGAVISQNSWGGYSQSSCIKAAVDYFISHAGIDQNGIQIGPMRGGVVIAAAGNANTNLMYYPAGFSNVIAVTSIGSDGKKPSYSNYGSWTDIAAPGGNFNITNGGIYSTITTANGGYGYMQGTSMACPHVSGIAALVLSRSISFGAISPMTPEILKETLFAACNQTELNRYNPGWYLGKGLIDADLAVNIPIPPSTTPILIGPNNLVEGEWGTFKIDWGGYRPGNDLIVEWVGSDFIEVKPFEEDKSRAYARTFDGGGYHSITARIKGNYNAWISKNFESTRIEGNFGRVCVTVYNSSSYNLDFTLHGTDIYNRLIPASSTATFASHLTTGSYQFKIDCFSKSSGNYPSEKHSFNGKITTNGASLHMEIENRGIRVIQFNHGLGEVYYRWFYQEGEGY